jgi:hypothetical protein
MDAAPSGSNQLAGIMTRFYYQGITDIQASPFGPSAADIR